MGSSSSRFASCAESILTGTTKREQWLEERCTELARQNSCFPSPLDSTQPRRTAGHGFTRSALPHCRASAMKSMPRDSPTHMCKIKVIK